MFSHWLFVYIFMFASVEEDCVLISSEREENKISGTSGLLCLAKLDPVEPL